MSAHHTTNGHATNAHHSAAHAATPTTPPKPTGRPRIFDDTMRREVRALVTAGCDLRYAARYVGCGISTLKRELERDPEFSDQIRRAEAGAAVHPLVAMHQAASTHWRAAAWMLERTMPERFARRPEKKFGQREARRLIADLIELLRAETMPPLIRERLEKRITALVKHATDTSAHPAQSARRLRDALHDSHDRLPDTPPLSDDFLPPMPTNPLAVFDDNYWQERQLWDEAFVASRQPGHPDSNPHLTEPLGTTDETAPSNDAYAPAPRATTREQLAPQVNHSDHPDPPAADSAPRQSPEPASSRPSTGAKHRDISRELATPAHESQEQAPHPVPRPSTPLPHPLETPLKNIVENSKVPPSVRLFSASGPEFLEEYFSPRPDPSETFERKNEPPRCVQNSRQGSRKNSFQQVILSHQ